MKQNATMAPMDDGRAEPIEPAEDAPASAPADGSRRRAKADAVLAGQAAASAALERLVGSEALPETKRQQESLTGIARAAQAVQEKSLSGFAESMGGMGALGEAALAAGAMSLPDGFFKDIEKQGAFFEQLQRDAQRAVAGLVPPPQVFRSPSTEQAALVHEIVAMPSPQRETVNELAALRQETVAQGALTSVHVGLTRSLVASTTTLIEALREGQAAQDRASQEQAKSNGRLFWLTVAMVFLTVVLAIPLVLDGLEWMGLIVR